MLNLAVYDTGGFLNDCFSFALRKMYYVNPLPPPSPRTSFGPENTRRCARNDRKIAATLHVRNYVVIVA